MLLIHYQIIIVNYNCKLDLKVSLTTETENKYLERNKCLRHLHWKTQKKKKKN